MATYSSNTTLKVNRAISGADTVSANAYAVCTYNATSSTNGSSNIFGVGTSSINRYFGPAQTIPASFTTHIAGGTGGTVANFTITYTLVSGVEFINTP